MAEVALEATGAIDSVDSGTLQPVQKLKCLFHTQDLEPMGGEIFNAAILSFTLVLVGLGAGYLLLRLAPDD